MTEPVTAATSVPVRSRDGVAEDAAGIGRLIGEAFCDLPPAQWLIADRDERLAMFPDYFRIFAEYALTHGTVQVLDGDPADGSASAGPLAAALWLPMTQPLPPPEDYDERLAAVCGPRVERFRTFDQTLEENHPEPVHHHLAFLAVTPRLQGRGIGSRLIAEYHDVLDGLGMPAYLEASDTRSRDLYLRHGYTVMGDPFHLPEGPPFFPMWRSPRQG